MCVSSRLKDYTLLVDGESMHDAARVSDVDKMESLYRKNNALVNAKDEVFYHISSLSIFSPL